MDSTSSFGRDSLRDRRSTSGFDAGIAGEDCGRSYQGLAPANRDVCYGFMCIDSQKAQWRYTYWEMRHHNCHYLIWLSSFALKHFHLVSHIKPPTSKSSYSRFLNSLYQSCHSRSWNPHGNLTEVITSASSELQLSFTRKSHAIDLMKPRMRVICARAERRGILGKERRFNSLQCPRIMCRLFLGAFAFHNSTVI